MTSLPNKTQSYFLPAFDSEDGEIKWEEIKHNKLVEVEVENC